MLVKRIHLAPMAIFKSLSDKNCTTLSKEDVETMTDLDNFWICKDWCTNDKIYFDRFQTPRLFKKSRIKVVELEYDVIVDQYQIERINSDAKILRIRDYDENDFSNLIPKTGLSMLTGFKNELTKF